MRVARALSVGPATVSTMVIAAIILGVVLVFATTRMFFGRAGAVGLAGLIGYFLGGPPGAATGLIGGLIVLPIVELLGFMLLASMEPAEHEPPRR